MNIALKNEIIAATKVYMTEKSMTAADLNKLTGVSQAYLSQMLNGKYSTGANGKDVEIADKYFLLLADQVGVNTEKVYWKTVVTKQMRQIITAAEVAKNTQGMRAVICPTGMGKTYCTELFQKQQPKHTYVLTINSLTRLHDVVNGLCELLELPLKGSKAMRLINIIIKLRDIKRSGGKPVIVFEEAENMEHALIKMTKGLFDGVLGYASIVLIGTNQLIDNMTKAKNQNMQGGPQFYRRFKAGIVRVSEVVNFEPFYDEFKVDKKVRKLLDRLCDNYGELHDFLEPAMREADEQGKPLTEDLFRVIHDINI